MTVLKVTASRISGPQVNVTMTRNADGACVSSDLPNVYIFLVGEAARLEDPPWPELALAALVGGWGVQ